MRVSLRQACFTTRPRLQIYTVTSVRVCAYEKCIKKTQTVPKTLQPKKKKSLTIKRKVSTLNYITHNYSYTTQWEI